MTFKPKIPKEWLEKRKEELFEDEVKSVYLRLQEAKKELESSGFFGRRKRKEKVRLLSRKLRAVYLAKGGFKPLEGEEEREALSMLSESEIEAEIASMFEEG